MGQTVRRGSKTLEVVLKTDELYGHDGLWLGPRGRDYGAMLPNPKPYQHANLYPDPNSSYWFAFLAMPEGSVLHIRGEFPHCRYFQFALYREDKEMGGYTATGEKYIDHQLDADPGSENPFVPGANRRVSNRSYTLRISNTRGSGGCRGPGAQHAVRGRWGADPGGLPGLPARHWVPGRRRCGPADLHRDARRRDRAHFG